MIGNQDRINEDWCILINRVLPEITVDNFNKGGWSDLLLMPVHIETYECFCKSPPLNRNWRLFKHGLTLDEASSFYKTDEGANLILDILEENGVKVKRITGNGSINIRTRFDVLSRDGFKCQLCGRSAKDGVKLEVDHKFPKSKGGGNSPDNLWTLCFECNSGKSAKIVDSIIGATNV